MPNKELKKTINKKIANDSRLKKTVNFSLKRFGSPRRPKPSELSGEAQPSGNTPQAVFALSLSAFSIDRDSYELKNTWILDSGANSHVCNDLTRFVQTRVATESDRIVSGKTIYQIKAFGTVEIIVQGANSLKPITLLDVALIPGFFTSIASLHRFTSKGVDWDTQRSRLYTEGATFCSVLRVGSYWTLEYTQLEPSALSSFAFSNSHALRAPVSGSAERWHTIMRHSGQDPISHLEDNTTGAIIKKSALSTSPCATCAISRATEIVSRRTSKETLADELIARIAYDLISMTPAYNKDEWISHFRDYYTKMDFVYTHRSKGQATAIVESFLNLIKTQFQLSVRFFRSDGERSLGHEFDAIIASRGIITERTAPYTASQNGAAERSGRAILTKARCLRIGVKLPDDLWPDIVRTVGYLNN